MLSMFYNMAFAAYFLAMILYFTGLFFKNKISPLLARVSIIHGVAALTLYMGVRWHIAQRPPLSNMFESLVVFAWAIGIATIFIDFKYKIKNVTALSALLSLIALSYASLLDKDIAPLLPALKSNWLTVHVLTCFIGYASLAVAFVASAVLLFGKNENILDSISYKMISFGFLFLTLGILSGAVWANEAWGTYWSWDPKETWSLVTWFIYAIYLHARIQRGWKGRKAAWLSVIGFLAMLFTYFGVNYLLSGLHSYA